MPEIPSQVVILVAIVAFAVLLLAIFRLQRRGRRADGQADSPLPDYNHVLAELRRQQAAETPSASPPTAARPLDDLDGRRQQKQRRVELRDLPEGERRAYFGAWQRLQAQAGPVPKLAVEQGLKLCDDVLRARGFLGEPPAGRVPSAALPSLEAVAVMSDYDRVRQIAERSARGVATTAELRQAMLLLQALFHHLLAVGSAPEEPRRYATG